jgi:hypothetical protein
VLEFGTCWKSTFEVWTQWGWSNSNARFEIYDKTSRSTIGNVVMDKWCVFMDAILYDIKIILADWNKRKIPQYEDEVLVYLVVVVTTPQSLGRNGHLQWLFLRWRQTNVACLLHHQLLQYICNHTTVTKMQRMLPCLTIHSKLYPVLSHQKLEAISVMIQSIPQEN